MSDRPIKETVCNLYE